ncbi:NAD(+) diphosphatase [Paenibacillus wulumuqiensis]|uniref:NAD(+) diphosphatase n=1 Tax=Paenibacillus wulumuqiensis TaxID=1567107 RepID=UPI000619481D|nr:NAD(+) diphosphatase [Paenibacillus wulumuqiensis]
MRKPKESIYKRYQPAMAPAEQENSTGYWFIFRGNELLVHENGEQPTMPVTAGPEPYGLQPVRSLYLGHIEQASCYTAELDADTEAPAGMTFLPLFALYDRIDEDLFHLAGRGLQMLAWDATYQFCGRCGSPLGHADHERSKVCPSCGLSHYPRLAPAVITLILKDNQLLLARAGHFKNNMYGLIAGFVEPGETLEDCVQRETMEEIGIRINNIRYFDSQPWPFPHSLMVGFIADYESGEIQVDGEEIVHADWFGVDNLPNIPPRISIARKMIDWYVEEHS